ncbi:MAG: peptide chain release factor N(5)-glutamine methyltransferase [Pseudomonadota bacterium]
MLISQALVLAKNNLKQKGVNSYQIDALLLLCHCLSFSKEQIIFNPNFILSQEQQNQFFSLIARRENREPISHIIGKREFFGNDFLVNNNVLDPRPDSESLIELAIDIFANQNQALEILELGVGSGCLLLTMLKLFPAAHGFGVDISDKALEIAGKNADLLGLSKRVDLIKSNWFSDIDPQKKFDLIISNPPYIKTNDILSLQEEVKNFEPNLALDGGFSGLDCYVLIAQNVKKFLKESAFLLLEIGQNQENDVIKIFNESGLKFIREKKDLSSIVRCLLFQNTKSDENI